MSGWADVIRGCNAQGCAVPPVCGDGVLQGTEECEPPNGVTCDTSCRVIPPPVCGNGTVEAGEQCDPPDGTTCDATCHTIPHAVCGNSVVEPGEDCEPPGTTACDATCHLVTCDRLPLTCGNGVVDAGEGCEPPGVGACNRDCQPATCVPPDAGEIDVACVEPSSSVAAAATSATVLVGWTALHRRNAQDVQVRRFDVNLAPLDAAATVVSDAAICGTSTGNLSMTSDGTDFYPAWFAAGDYPLGGYFGALRGRRVSALGMLASTDEHGFQRPFGQCSAGFTAAVAVDAPAPGVFALVGENVAGCLGQIFYRTPFGVRFAFGPSGMTSTGLGIGYPYPPVASSTAPAALASHSGRTLVAWPAASGGLLDGAWSDTGGAHAMPIEARPGMALEPGLAAGTDAILVAWPHEPASGPATIRAVRVSPTGGILDVAGSQVIATVAGTIGAIRPVVVFDGTVWLVAWLEQSGSRTDVRGVAVRADGSVVDPTPRILASDVAHRTPAMASAGNGQVVLVYVRADGTHHAVRARVVPGS